MVTMMQMAAAGGLRALAKRVAEGSTARLPTATHVRRMSGRLGVREQKLLEEDPDLREFSSNKAKVQLIKTIGNVLVLAVVAGATYEIYYRVNARKAAQAEGTTTGDITIE